MNNPIRRCAGSCGRLTRPRKSLITDHPGTVARCLGDECQSCFMSRTSEPADPYTVAGLESFLARRRVREAAMFRREMIAR